MCTAISYPYYSIIYIYFFKRKFTENVLQNTPNCTIDKKSGEYAPNPYVPIPLNIVCAVIHYLLFVYKKMNIFTIIFFHKILAKYSPKRTKLHHFKIFFSGGTCPRTPLTNAWLRSHFSKNIFNPPPPPVHA